MESGDGSDSNDSFYSAQSDGGGRPGAAASARVPPHGLRSARGAPQSAPPQASSAHSAARPPRPAPAAPPLSLPRRRGGGAAAAARTPITQSAQSAPPGASQQFTRSPTRWTALFSSRTAEDTGAGAGSAAGTAAGAADTTPTEERDDVIDDWGDDLDDWGDDFEPGAGGEGSGDGASAFGASGNLGAWDAELSSGIALGSGGDVWSSALADAARPAQSSSFATRSKVFPESQAKPSRSGVDILGLSSGSAGNSSFNLGGPERSSAIPAIAAIGRRGAGASSGALRDTPRQVSATTQASGLRALDLGSMATPTTSAMPAEKSASGDAFGLRASEFDTGSPAVPQTPQTSDALLASVIGISADPTAEKDDWADDFQLDSRLRAGAGTPTFRRSLAASGDGSADTQMTAVMSLLLDQTRDRDASGKDAERIDSRKRERPPRTTPARGSLSSSRGPVSGLSKSRMADSDDEFHSVDGTAETERDDIASVSATLPSEASLAFPALGASTVPYFHQPGRTRDVRLAPDPVVPASRVVLTVNYGEEDGDVHPSCRRFLDMWSRHLGAIENHLESLREDRISMEALEISPATVYSLSNDPDVARVLLSQADSFGFENSFVLYPDNFGVEELQGNPRSAMGTGHRRQPEDSIGLKRLSADGFGNERDRDASDMIAKEIFLWKLEYAKLLNDTAGVVKVLIAIARFERENGVSADAFGTLDEATIELSKLRASEYELLCETLRIEIQYELAHCHRSVGMLDVAAESFERAYELGMALSASTTPDPSASSEQRGIWWALECKYMLGECLYQQGNCGKAVQHYVEYAMQAIARMIGLIVPSHPDQDVAGKSLMRYCLFTPRRLALSVWYAALCLSDLGVVEVAQNVGNVALRTSTTLGIEDVRVATVDFCARVKLSLRDARRLQSEALSASDRLKSEGEVLEGTLSDWVDEEGSMVYSNLEHAHRDDEDFEMDDPFGMNEEDWDAQIERDYQITIQRCSEVPAGHGDALFSNSEGNAINAHGISAGQPGTSENLTLSPGGEFSAGALVTQHAERPEAGNTAGHGGRPQVSFADPGSHEGNTEASGVHSGSNNLTEAELRQYLSRLNAVAVNITSQQTLYPRPTQSFFQLPAFGPKEHEAFVRDFVRGRINELSPGVMPFGAQFGSREPAAEAIRLRSDIERQETRHNMHSYRDSISMSSFASLVDTNIVRDCMRRVRHLDRGSLPFVFAHQEAVWNVCRSQSCSQRKRDEIRALVNSAFSDALTAGVSSSRIPIISDADSPPERLAILGSLLEILKIARDLLSPDGKDASWFTRAVMVLMTAATTLAPAAKAVVELFRAESRAHCGVVRVTTPGVLDLCAAGMPGPTVSSAASLRGMPSVSSTVYGKDGSNPFLSVQNLGVEGRRGAPDESSNPFLGSGGTSAHERSGLKLPPLSVNLRVPDELRVSVVDVLHNLYWRTKAGVDESNTQPDALERLVHAEVSAALYLVLSGVSPVSGAPVDISKDEAVLNLSRLRSGLVDDTRRVQESELVSDLRMMWGTLPDTAAHVRARVCLALARHTRVQLRDSGVAERLLFDGLLYVDKATPKEATGQMPRPSLCVSSHASPLAAVACPLVAALLYEYGCVSLGRAKYRYGIAALESAAEALKARDPHNAGSLAAAKEVATVALSEHDWRRALTWLFDMRERVHPSTGHRNAFIQLCIVLFEICSDSGFFEAASVPLRAYSALIFEEKLRTLLRRYRSRLTKKARSRRRIKLATSVLPSAFPRARSVALGRSCASPGWDRKPHALSGRRAFSTSPSFAQTPGDGSSFGRERLSSAVARPSAGRGSNTWASKAARVFAGISKRTSVRQTAAVAAVAAAVARSPSRGFENREEQVPSSAERGFRPSANGSSRSRVRRGKSVGASSSRVTDVSDILDEGSDEEREELFAIAEEQAAVADSEYFEVELLRARAAFDRGSYADAEEVCRSLLDMTLPARASRYFVLEIIARIRLKRREITRCVEVIEQMEQEASLFPPRAISRDYSKDPRSSLSGPDPFHPSRRKVQEIPAGSSGIIVDSHPGVSSDFDAIKGSMHVDSERASLAFLPEIAFLRLSALLHGGRLNEALSCANEFLNVCPEDQLWHRAKLHYMRGKVIFSMCSSATAPFDNEEVAAGASIPVASVLDTELVELALSAFEIASGYYDAAGDEVGVVKSDLRWSQTVIDVLFRRVVLPRLAGESPVELSTACRFGGRSIVLPEVEDVVLSALSFLSAANLPLLTIDALAALAEVKCISGESSARWAFWVSEAWKLISRLLTDPEEHKIVLSSLAPVSTLMRLKSLCGRLVRLVLCSNHSADVESINIHLGIFEAYVTLQIDIDRQMNLASSAHASKDAVDGDASTFSHLNGSMPVNNSGLRGTKDSPDIRKHHRSPSAGSPGASEVRRNAGSWGPFGASPTSEDAKDRPAGAFLHIIGDEGIALGRQGLNVVINRPGQVMNAIRETGAVLLPRNLYESRARQRESATSRTYKRNRDAEYIFPFNEKIGLGAMHILDDTAIEEVPNAPPFNMMDSDRESDLAIRTLDFDDIVAESEAGHADPAENVKGSQHDVPSRGSGDADAARALGSDMESGIRSHSISRHETGFRDASFRQPNALSLLVDAVRELHDGNAKEHMCLGTSMAEKVWGHMHRLKVETKRYSRGEITVEEMGQRNGATLRSWLLCVPRTRRDWSVPETLGKRLVYILYAHGVVGYYSVDRGSCVSRLEFGGKQIADDTATVTGNGQQAASAFPTQVSFGGRTPGNAASSTPRPPNNAERKFLYGLVKDWKARGNKWFKDRESEIIAGLAKGVLRTPRVLLDTGDALPRGKTQKNRPIILIVDLTLQVFPWELFMDHIVVRSLSLLDSIRGLQDDSFKRHNQQALQEAMVFPTVALNRRIVRFINFASPRREGGDLERSEEARRQQLAFQSLLRLNHMSPPRLIASLGLGGFSDPTALNAVARPTGPLSTPLTQASKAVHLLGMRIEASLGRKNYPLLDFVKVPGLGSASTADLREASLISVVQKKTKPNERDIVRRELGAYIAVFLFTYADLVDVTESVFGLLKAMPRGILIFAPATKMKVVARHLEDEELDAELQQVSGRRNGRIVPDIGASTRVIVEYVSRFSRSKLIPIVVFLGEGLADMWPRSRRVRGRDAAAGPAARATSGIPRETSFARPHPQPPMLQHQTTLEAMLIDA